MHTSKNLSTVDEEHLLDQFYTVLAELKNPETVQEFLLSFMTPTERMVFAKRLHIAWLLKQGRSYDEIGKHLKVSSATISAIAENKNSKGIKRVLAILQLNAAATNSLSKLLFWKHSPKG